MVAGNDKVIQQVAETRESAHGTFTELRSTVPVNCGIMPVYHPKEFEKDGLAELQA